MGAEHVCHVPRVVRAGPNVNSWPLMRNRANNELSRAEL